MKIAAIVQSKNECDVIESFVRHNSKFIDDFYFIDHSTDNTKQILSLLSNEGFAIYQINADGRDYNEVSVNTGAAQLINKDKKYEFIFFLDADEIIYCKDKQIFLESINKGTANPVGTFRPQDFPPNGKPYFSSLNPLKDCFAIQPANEWGRKIFIRGDFSDNVLIGAGKHEAFKLDLTKYEPYDSEIILGNFPYRSPEQFISRVVTNYARIIASHQLGTAEGSHVKEQFKNLVENDFYGEGDILNFAYLFYKNENLEMTKLLYLEDVKCKYHSLAKRNAVKEIAVDFERMAKLLRTFRMATKDVIQHVEELSKIKSLL